MALGTGVELEWAIVYYSLLEAGLSASELSKRTKASGGKLKSYGAAINAQAKAAVAQVKKKNPSLLKYAFHSDELKIVGNPEPKTDVVFRKGGEDIRCSVKMLGPIQLSSGQGESTARMFELVLDSLKDKQEISVLKDIIKRIRDLPTRLLSEQNLARVLKEKPDRVKDLVKNGRIIKEKNYEEWVKNNKEALMADLLNYLKKHQEFHTELIREALTGQKTFRTNKPAIATHILTPNTFEPINDAYVKKMLSKTKIDIRAKSRGGITSVAFRFDVRA